MNALNIGASRGIGSAFARQVRAADLGHVTHTNANFDAAPLAG